MELDLSLYPNAHTASIHPLIERLPKLRLLNLDSTGVGNALMETISKYCPLLQVLHLDCCERITDRGIGLLVRRLPAGLYSCGKLQTLYLELTKVTVKGLVHVLKYVPTLVKMRHSELPSAILSLYTQKECGLLESPLNLDTLEITNQEYGMKPQSKVHS